MIFMKKQMVKVLFVPLIVVMTLGLVACGGGGSIPAKRIDKEAPSIPAELKVGPSEAGEVIFSWVPSHDNVGVSLYRIYRDGSQIGKTSASSVTGTSYLDRNLVAGSSHQYQTSACDVAGNCSSLSLILYALAGGSNGTDSLSPSIPAALVTNGSTVESISLTWQASTDNVAVLAYEIWRNGTRINTSAGTSYVDTGLAAATEYSYTVRAFDAAGNSSAPGDEVRASTLSPVSAVDNTAPTSPGGLVISQSTVSSLSLSWTASSDNVAVTGYELYLNGVVVGISASTAYTFVGLNTSTSYNLSLKAFDASGNKSSISAVVSASTADASGAPSISAANIVANVITVNGSSFGQRGQAAPIKFEDFDAQSTGATPASIGYTNYGGFGGSTTVDQSQSYSGGKSLKHQGNFGAVSGADVAESFPHIAVTGFSSNELFLSYRLKFRTNGSRIVQLKFNRSGMEVAGASGSPCYGGKPKFYSSYYPDGPSVNRYSSDKRLLSVQGGVLRDNDTRDEGWVGESSSGSGTVLPLLEDAWVQVEEYYRLNDIGQANGEHVTWVNGNLQFNRHDLTIRSLSSQLLNCSYLVVGMDYWINPSSTNGVTVWYDDHYLDSSRARLVLANNAAWNLSTIRSPQPATQWSAAGVTAPLRAAGFAPGSDAWLYVVRADGLMSSAWKIRLP